MVAFVPASGIGVFWPFGGPIVVDPNDPDTDYAPAPDVFGPLANGPFGDHVTSAVIGQVQAAGFDHVRLQVHLGPWMQAVREQDPAYQSALFALLDPAIFALVDARLGVTITAYLSGYVRDAPAQVLTTLNDPEYLAYRGALAALAQRYADLDAALVAIELFNEPPSGLPEGAWAGTFLPDLYEVTRAAAPGLTLVLGGDDYSSLSALAGLDPATYDANVLWTAHPFIPAPAALQGFTGDQYQYVTGLHFPPQPARRAAAISAMSASVNADGSLTPQQKSATIAGLTSDLDSYFETPEDAAWIADQCAVAAGWASENDLPASVVYIGEYGVTRVNAGYQGAAQRDRVNLYGALSAAASGAGFRSSAIHLDTIDYGVTRASGAAIGAFDPQILAAIAP